MNIHSYVKEQLKIAADQRKRCQEQYPDWKDDEFNCADNRFVWGISFNPELTPSFCTLNCAQVYHNRRNHTYYLDIDPEVDSASLKAAVDRFEAFVYLTGEDVDRKMSLEELGMDLFSSNSLATLLCKFKLFAAGYFAMRGEDINEL